MKKYISNFYIIILLFSFLFLGFFTFVFFYAAQRLEQRQLDNLILELSKTEYEITKYFDDVDVMLNTISFFIQSEPQDDAFQAYLYYVTQESDFISSTYFGKPDQTIINSNGFIPPPDFDLTTRLWYQLALDSREVIYTPAFLNASQDKIIITVAKAVYIEENFIGVVASDIDITTIRYVVSEKVIGKSGFPFLIDQEGHMIAHPKLNLSVLELTEANLLLDHLSEFSENTTHFNFKINGTKGVLSHTSIFDGTYTLGVFISNGEYYQSTHVFTSIMLVLVGIVVTLILILTFVNRKFIFKPLQKLVLDIDTIHVEKRPNYRMSIVEKLGFLEIRNAMNSVLDTTTSYFDIIQNVKHSLAIENQRVSLLMNSTADIIFEIDMNKKFVTVVGKGLEKLGHNSEDYIGKSVLELFGENAMERDRYYDEALNGEKKYYYWQFQKDENLLYFESSISPIYDEKNLIIGAVGISRDISDQMEKQHEIEYINAHDFLTGLYNRRYFVEKIEEYDHKKYYPLGIMMMDLNGLKIINDAFGHTYGDFALTEVAQVFRNNFCTNDIVARMGGDEFAVIMPKITVERIENIKNKIRDDLSRKQINNIQVSVAIGYEIKYNHDLSIEEVMKRAENYMYRNKLSEGMSIRNHAIKAILQTLTDKYSDERLHLEKVSQICVEFGKILDIKDDRLKELELAGMYHDIGKIAIPDAILNKPGKLTSSEYDFMKTHVEAGYQILKAADGYSKLAEYALTHHEKWDGTGYPRGLKEKEIPLFSRIISIVDAYDAMTSVRVYKDKMSEQEAISEIIRCAGTQFDPRLAKIFVIDYLKEEWKETISNE